MNDLNSLHLIWICALTHELALFLNFVYRSDHTSCCPVNGCAAAWARHRSRVNVECMFPSDFRIWAWTPWQTSPSKGSWRLIEVLWGSSSFTLIEKKLTGREWFITYELSRISWAANYFSYRTLDWFRWSTWCTLTLNQMSHEMYLHLKFPSNHWRLLIFCQQPFSCAVFRLSDYYDLSREIQFTLCCHFSCTPLSKPDHSKEIGPASGDCLHLQFLHCTTARLKPSPSSSETRVLTDEILAPWPSVLLVYETIVHVFDLKKKKDKV